MFRSICSDDFDIPRTMARDRIPTGGRNYEPEGKGLGWCIVSLLEGLLEKDQEKRVSLADVKVHELPFSKLFSFNDLSLPENCMGSEWCPRTRKVAP